MAFWRQAKRTGGTGAFTFAKSMGVSTAVHTVECAPISAHTLWGVFVDVKVVGTVLR